MKEDLNTTNNIISDDELLGTAAHEIITNLTDTHSQYTQTEARIKQLELRANIFQAIGALGFLGTTFAEFATTQPTPQTPLILIAAFSLFVVGGFMRLNSRLKAEQLDVLTTINDGYNRQLEMIDQLRHFDTEDTN